MLVILLVALFCFALIVTLVGLYLSPRPRTRTQGDVVYITRKGASPLPPRRVSQGDYLRDVYRDPAVGQPYRRLRRSSTPIGHVGVRRGQAPSLQVPNYRFQSLMGEAGVRDIGGLWGAYIPHWLRLTLLFGTVFSLCLFLFIQLMSFSSSPALAIISNFASQPTPVPTNTALYGEDLGVSDASKSIVRLAQMDRGQYNSQEEYDQWAASACSAASMTEIINAYGNNYRITDILKAEIDVHAISPELGLLEAKGIGRTMARFGFKMVPLQNSSLDSAVAIANRGYPVIISFANSGYWPGGHILVLRGGDAQNIFLADSSRLNLTVISRDQFLQWWRGFTALAVPQ